MVDETNKLSKSNPITDVLKHAEQILRANPSKARSIVVDYRKELTDPFLITYCSLIEAKALWYMSQFQEAIFIAEKVKTEILDFEDVSLIAHADNILGNIYFDLDNKTKALDYYISALSYAKLNSPSKSEAFIANNIGEIYYAYNAFEDALRYYLMSLEILEAIASEPTMGIVHLNLAHLYFNQNSIYYANKHIHISLEYALRSDNYMTISHAHLLLARIFKQQKDYVSAHKELTISTDLSKKVNDLNELIDIYIFAVELLLEEKLYTDALLYAQEALILAQDLKFHKRIGRIAFLIATTYETIMDFSQAIQYYKIYQKNISIQKSKKLVTQKRLILAQSHIDEMHHEKETYRLKSAELEKKSKKIEELYENMKTIHTIGQAITATLHLKEIVHLLYTNINKLMPATYFGIIYYEHLTNTLVPHFILEFGRSRHYPDLYIENRNSVATWCVQHRQAILSNNYKVDYEKYTDHYTKDQFVPQSSNSLIFIPLIAKNHLIGLVTVQSMHQSAYSNYHFDMLKTLSAYITIAIKNSQESQRLSLEVEKRIQSQNELEEMNKKLSIMTYMDELTQIPNRRSFIDHVNYELAIAKRKSKLVTLLLIDIDYFKQYNDYYGHLEGDRCITTIAQLLKNSLRRKVDFIARYGGDEFIAFLSEIQRDDLELLIEKINLSIKNAAIRHKQSKVSKYVTVTIGAISRIPTPDYTMEQLFYGADKALYLAKNRGRNQHAFYD